MPCGYLLITVIEVFNLFQRLTHRLIAAFSTIPSAEDWLYSVALVLVLTAISLAIGFYWSFLQVEILTSWETVAYVIATCIWTPAIAEEVFFRVLLLPHLDENPSFATQWLWGCISLAMFIIYHPLNGLSFYPAGLKTFLNPVFLLLAAILGIVCTLAYWQSGSLWSPVIIHWLTVVVWLLLLGGYSKLSA